MADVLPMPLACSRDCWRRERLDEGTTVIRASWVAAALVTNAAVESAAGIDIAEVVGVGTLDSVCVEDMLLSVMAVAELVPVVVDKLVAAAAVKDKDGPDNSFLESVMRAAPSSAMIGVVPGVFVGSLGDMEAALPAGGVDEGIEETVETGAG